MILYFSSRYQRATRRRLSRSLKGLTAGFCETKLPRPVSVLMSSGVCCFLSVNNSSWFTHLISIIAGKTLQLAPPTKHRGIGSDGFEYVHGSIPGMLTWAFIQDKLDRDLRLRGLATEGGANPIGTTQSSASPTKLDTSISALSISQSATDEYAAMISTADLLTLRSDPHPRPSLMLTTKDQPSTGLSPTSIAPC